jgi:hypothetical protein
MKIKKIILLALLVISFPVKGTAQTAQEVNEANNPLTSKITVNLQNQYVGSYYGNHSSAGRGCSSASLPTIWRAAPGVSGGCYGSARPAWRATELSPVAGMQVQPGRAPSGETGEVRGGANGWARVKSGFVFPILCKATA